MKYELFFFKENNRYLDIEELFRYFNYCPYITVDTSKEDVEVVYYNKAIELKASFHLTKVSKVPDIYRLSPKFLDLDIYLSADPMMPMFKFNVLVDFVSDLCKKFDFSVYNILFEDVSIFRKELVLKSYELMRSAYNEKFPMEYTSLNYVPKEKVNDIFKYLYERKDLETYCHGDDLYFPVPYFVKSNSTGQVYLASDLEEDKLYVFPPQCDLLFYRNNDKFEIIYADELLSVVEKYTYDLPGFIHDTKVLDKTGARKLRKIISRTKFSEINDSFSNIDLETIIDFK